MLCGAAEHWARECPTRGESLRASLLSESQDIDEFFLEDPNGRISKVDYEEVIGYNPEMDEEELSGNAGETQEDYPLPGI